MDDTEKKEHWPEGPWTNEPDREEFRHAGMDCLAAGGGGAMLTIDEIWAFCVVDRRTYE